jgi:hypothetical protein
MPKAIIKPTADWFAKMSVPELEFEGIGWVGGQDWGSFDP